MLAILTRIATVLLSISFCHLADLAFAFQLPPEPNSGNPRTIFYSYTLENGTPTTVKGAEFFALAPVQKTSYQYCMNVTASHPFSKHIDTVGNHILRFVFDVIPPHARKVVSIHAQVWKNDKEGWPISINPSTYLSPAQYIESGHEKIFRKARSLLDVTPMKTAERIYHFVSEHVHSDGFSSGELGALYALVNGKGDCTESMYLFVALCRAAGVPARGIGGYTLTANPVLRPSRYHNWAEFHDGKSWQIADPQQKVFAASQSNYIAMKVLNGSPDRQSVRFHRFYVGDDRLRVAMNE